MGKRGRWHVVKSDEQVCVESILRSNKCRDFTYDDYLRLKEEQGGRCAICDQVPPPGRYRNRLQGLVLDHCHKTNKVRGLVCYPCNTHLGHLEKEFDPAWKESAIRYKETAPERIAKLREGA